MDAKDVLPCELWEEILSYVIESGNLFGRILPFVCRLWRDIISKIPHQTYTRQLLPFGCHDPKIDMSIDVLYFLLKLCAPKDVIGEIIVSQDLHEWLRVYPYIYNLSYLREAIHNRSLRVFLMMKNRIYVADRYLYECLFRHDWLGGFMLMLDTRPKFDILAMAVKYNAINCTMYMVEQLNMEPTVDHLMGCVEFNADKTAVYLSKKLDKYWDVRLTNVVISAHNMDGIKYVLDNKLPCSKNLSYFLYNSGNTILLLENITNLPLSTDLASLACEKNDVQFLEFLTDTMGIYDYNSTTATIVGESYECYEFLRSRGLLAEHIDSRGITDKDSFLDMCLDIRDEISDFHYH